jgi:hypothetical protein
MALIIGGGISIGGNVTITAENINPTANLVLFYDAGNSMSYSGSGIQFNTTYTGPNLDTYEQYGVLDLAGLTGGPWNSGQLVSFDSGPSGNWASQGVCSYWTFDANNTQYINSEYQTEQPTLTSPTYTMLAVVRPQDFAQGAIVGGDENIFYFRPDGGLNNGPTLVANNNYDGYAIADTSTAYELNTWYCVAVTYDAGSRTMKLYTNGALVATNTDVDPPTHPTGLYWGTLEGQLWFTGNMAVCMAYERVVSAGEISQLSDVFLSRYIAPPATSSVVSTPPYYGPPSWTVPEGVTSISVVAVGAGGGGTQDSYSPPGGDSVMLKLANMVDTVTTTFTGTSNTIIVDTTSYPNIANVQANGTWVVSGNDIAGQVPAFDLVTGVNTDGSNTVITINNTITTTAGDTFNFYEAVVAAEGGYEIDDSYYSANPELSSGWGPGRRAQPLVTDGPYGAGGVVDWTDSWPLGGGGAGGYGIPGLAWNINQAGEWYYFDNNAYHTMNFTNNNLTVNSLVDANTAGIETTVVGTKTIATGAKIMYSLTIDQVSTVAGYCGVGLSNYGQNLWDYVGSNGNASVGYYNDGAVNINGGVADTYDAFTTGSTVDIAVNMISGYAWFRVNGGLWNNNPAADPVFIPTSGFDIAPILAQGLPISVAASPYSNGTNGDIISIATASTYIVPEGYTFVPGVAGAGGTGGDGAADYGPTAMPGTGGAGGGGGGRLYDSGGGGGGTGLYGRGTSGTAGSWVNAQNVPDIATGGGGGSDNAVADGTGGQATPWNGGRGGWPGGAGSSATGYYDGGNGGALAYRNNYAVTPGESYFVFAGQGGLGQDDGGSGADGAIRIVWPGDTRQFPSTNVGPDTVAVPTLAITDYNFPLSNPNGTVEWNITSDGGGTVLETGIVWGMPGQDTYTTSVDVCDGNSSTAQRKAIRAADSCGNPYTTGLTGTQTLNFQPYYQFYDELINVRVYARNKAGVAYSPTTLTWTPSICLAEGTLVTLADGNTKPIESITMTDLIKVWDFDLGQYASAHPLWIKQKQSTTQYNLIRFSDGSELKTIGQHRIFNKEAGAFTYPMTDATPVGTTTIKTDGTEVTVTSKQVVYEAVNYYNVVTAGGYMNLYANDILTSMRYNNIYPISNMQYSKDGRVLRDRTEFAGIADRWIDGLRLPEQTIDIKHIKKYVDRLENNEQQEITTPARPAWHK